MRYRIKTPVDHGTTRENVRRYEPGELIDLSEEHAAPLLESGAIELEHQPFAVEVNKIFIKA